MIFFMFSESESIFRDYCTQVSWEDNGDMLVKDLFLNVLVVYGYTIIAVLCLL